jgi:alanyl-tRNA synthetase
MLSEEIRDKFLTFFREKGHVIIQSASLVPENDPTTLLTGSGMQPLIPYLFGKPHPGGKRVANSQKCFRADDMKEVGDNRHTTFFEMLGNWSFGDYFKKEQLQWFFGFLTDVVGLDPNKLYVTVFSGDEKNNIPKDNESALIWEKLFNDKKIHAKTVDILTCENGGEHGMHSGRIFYYDAETNWWSRKGLPDDMPTGELGGPDSEVFYEFTDIEHDEKFGKHCHLNCGCGRYLEIGNSVFMEYKKAEDGTFHKLSQHNVDFGGGLERITAASVNMNDIFLTDIFLPIIEKISEIKTDLDDGIKRIFADHLRGSAFLIADGVAPSNKEAGYILRRLLRRVIAYQIKYEINQDVFKEIIQIVSEKFGVIYPNLRDNKAIVAVIEEEIKKFKTTISKGLRELAQYKTLTAPDVFRLYESYGLPFDLVKEFAPAGSLDNIGQEDFDNEFKRHQEVSRAGAGKKFGGHGLIMDTGEIKAIDQNDLKKVTQLHTATHLLQAALREVLGNEVKQKGSDITVDRTRFDFLFPRKVTQSELREIQEIVNEIIEKDLPVGHVEMPLNKAKDSDALYVDSATYPDMVHVYYVGDSIENAVSREICGGPHVNRTGEIGKFTINKEESISAGVRRIRAEVI